MAHYRYNQELGKIEEFSLAEKKICSPLICVKANLAYSSIIDGKAITTWAKRDRELKENNCVPYGEAKEIAYDARRNLK